MSDRRNATDVQMDFRSLSCNNQVPALRFLVSVLKPPALLPLIVPNYKVQVAAWQSHSAWMINCALSVTSLHLKLKMFCARRAIWGRNEPGGRFLCGRCNKGESFLSSGVCPRLKLELNLERILAAGGATLFSRREQKLKRHLWEVTRHLFWKLMVHLYLAEIAVLFDGDPNKSEQWQKFSLWEPIALNKEVI